MVSVAVALLIAVSGGVSAEPASPAPNTVPAPSTPTTPKTPTAPATPSAPASTPAQTPATAPAKPAAPTQPRTDKKLVADSAVDPYVLGFTMQDIDGKDVDLAQYKGQVVMIVNVASKCGYTPQYAGLEKLYKEKTGKGFVILGFPANDFGEQEPGTNSEIKSFCSSKYNVTFPMFSKISVRGSEQHPLFKKMSAQPKPLGGEGVPGWNFTKFIVDRQGNIVARFDSKVKPDDAGLVKKIDELLAAK
ncbi:MAG: glutathione peroxidase [Phycisphaerales bacterium]